MFNTLGSFPTPQTSKHPLNKHAFIYVYVYIETDSGIYLDLFSNDQYLNFSANSMNFCHVVLVFVPINPL